MGNNNSFDCHRSAVALFAKFLLALVPLSLCYVSLRFALSNSKNGSSLSWITTLYRIICAGLVLEMIRLYFNELYVFGHTRVMHFRGRISFRYNRVSIAYKDIRDIGIKQSILGRLLNYGTVTLGTASTDEFEIAMADLPSPHTFSSYIQEHAEKLRKETESLQVEPEQKKLPTTKLIADNRA